MLEVQDKKGVTVTSDIRAHSEQLLRPPCITLIGSCLNQGWKPRV